MFPIDRGYTYDPFPKSWFDRVLETTTFTFLVMGEYFEAQNEELSVENKISSLNLLIKIGNDDLNDIEKEKNRLRYQELKILQLEQKISELERFNNEINLNLLKLEKKIIDLTPKLRKDNKKNTELNEFVKKCKELISGSQMNILIELLKDCILKKSKLYNYYIQICGMYNNNEEKFALGLMENFEYDLSQNKIRASFIFLIDSLQQKDIR